MSQARGSDLEQSAHASVDAQEVARVLAMLEEAIDGLPASVVLVDATATIVFANGRWQVSAHERGLALPRAGVGTNYLAVCDASAQAGDADAARVGAGLRDVLARRRLTFETEYLMEHAGGAPQRYRLFMAALEAGGALIHHQDVSTEWRAQRARTEAAAYFESLFEGSLDGTVLFDDDLRIILANRAAAELCQSTVAQLTGRSLLDLVHPEDLGAVTDQHERLLQRGAARGVLRLLRANGSVADIEVASRANVVAGRHLASWRDVTAQRQLEAQLRQSQKMEAVGQLAGGIAHDFNNLLTVILAHAELLLDEVADGVDTRADATAGLRDIQRAARRGADMVGKLLAFGRQGQLRLVPARVDDILREACEMMRRLLPESIAVHYSCHGVLPPVQVDVTAIQQVLLNLATNARDAIGTGGGTLHMTARLSDGSATTARGADHEAVDGHVVISVSDTGCGMSAETLARLFEPFFTTKAPGSGTGLGMPMVFGLMGQMHGRVTVESRLEAGTIVHLHLPVTRQPVVEPARTVIVGAPPATPTASIMLVEDDVQIRRLAVRILSAAGYAVDDAADGNDAYRRLAERHAKTGRGPTLIISDIVMPGGGGARVLEAWQRYAPDARILWMTGYAGDARTQEGTRTTRQNALIQKPWTGAELLAKVRDVLGDPAPVHVPGAASIIRV